ncbi:hypothetical protein PSHI8_23900 [Polynucleobacter sp. SHI8]|nr:hypothetical protein PSHI2_23880 [Polynucleobacter sp. SHI2]BDW14754.1 hypothetical protein PSHI8_23900 [Polynucleobacter sp. SHI8]
MTQIENKTETLNLRVSRQVKFALRVIAKNERRSMANMIEILISEYYSKKSYSDKSDDVIDFETHSNSNK